MFVNKSRDLFPASAKLAAIVESSNDAIISRISSLFEKSSRGESLDDEIASVHNITSDGSRHRVYV